MSTADQAFVHSSPCGDVFLGRSRRVASLQRSRPSLSVRIRQSRRSPAMSAAGDPSQPAGRAPWPFTRFLRTALWYSPLGGLVGRVAAPRGPATTTPAPRASRKGPKRNRNRTTVLVTGASGGVGSRVVRELLRDGSSVRALVRSRDRAVEALGRIGLNHEAVEEYERSGKLQWIVSDLYNIKPQMFAGVDAVISATGTRVGPANDTPDRAMYNQGTTFYQPTVLEDTPENVEYRGVKELAEIAAKSFQASASADESDDDSTVPVWTFSNPDDVRATWGSLDDVVMGGVSRSNVDVVNGELVFSGMLSVSNNGGFASTRSVEFPNPIDLSVFDGLVFKAKGDGKRYKFFIRCDGRWDGLSYCFSFETTANEWVDIKIPFTSFQPVFRAKTRPESPPLDVKHISALQIMLSKFEYDGDLNPKFSPGEFTLRLQPIRAYADVASRPAFPRFVHLGTSGSTRVLRAGEPGLVESVADFQNKTLGRIMEWKLAGEDAVRQALAKYGYVVVRTTALTVDEPVGLDSLRISQGDNIVGKVPRDDCARLLVEALYDGNVVNTTFEIAQKNSASTAANIKFADRVAKLSIDSDDSKREFGAFPYVPK